MQETEKPVIQVEPEQPKIEGTTENQIDEEELGKNEFRK